MTTTIVQQTRARPHVLTLPPLSSAPSTGP